MLLKVKIKYYIVQKSGFLKCRQNENSRHKTDSFPIVTIVVCVQLFHNNCNICLKYHVSKIIECIFMFNIIEKCLI